MCVSFTPVSTPVLLGADSKQPLGADSQSLSFVLLLFNCSIEIVWLSYVSIGLGTIFRNITLLFLIVIHHRYHIYFYKGKNNKFSQKLFMRKKIKILTTFYISHKSSIDIFFYLTNVLRIYLSTKHFLLKKNEVVSQLLVKLFYFIPMKHF